MKLRAVPSLLFRISLLAALCSIASGQAKTAAPPARIQGYSADVAGVQDGAAVSGKIYFMPDKLRMEQNAGGTKTILILDRKQKMMWILNTGEKTYGEVDLSNPAVAINMPFPDETGKPCIPMRATTCIDAGRELINDRQCDRWEVTASDGEKTVKTTIWIDPTLGAPIRWKNETGDHYDLSNIKPGPQQDTLFQLPEGYKKNSA